MRNELFFYTGRNPNALAKFLGVPDSQIELEPCGNNLSIFYYEDLAITPMSLVLYVHEDDVFDFFLIDA